MLISYKWLKSYIPEIPSVDKLTELITFNLCEIEDVKELSNGDFIFDLKILPDRAHDLLSHKGVAYEISGLLGLKVKENEYQKIEGNKTNLQIEIQTPQCSRYLGRIVRGVKIAPSPDWVVQYLESIGQRSINNIVDATNIVLFDIGQPIHAFDLNKLKDEKIVVKNANDGDELYLVGSEKLKAKLKDKDIVITDGIKNLAVAGVKGGLDSGIDNETTNILIEVANFDAISVRKTARRLGIQTDASKRYENDLSPILCDKAMDEISALILEMCPGALFEEVIDIYNKKPEQRSVSFSTKYICRALGVEIKKEEIERILKNYNYEFIFNDDNWTIKVPNLRLDITGGHDMVEEIGRAYGYEKIKGEIPVLDFHKKDNDTWTKICFAKNKLIKDGYFEVMNYALTNKGEIEILAAASDKNFLRTNLLDGLLKSYEFNRLNLPFLEISEIKIFEVGTIFTKKGEEIHVAYCDKKNKVEITLDEFVSDFVEPEFNPVVSGSPVFKLWSLYPFITRDIAVWLPEGEDKKKLENIFDQEGTELLIKKPYLFDQFTKEGRTSFAYRLVFQSYDRTLTDEEVTLIMSKINEKIISLNWEIR